MKKLILIILLFSSEVTWSSGNTGHLPSVFNLIMEEVAVCGDGKLQSPEVCDDGNLFEGDFCENSCKTPGPLAGINAPGRWGKPENTFILTDAYDFDLQAAYPQVNWQTLDRLYIAAGEYSAIWLGNLPQRSPDRPLIITNYGGQVKVPATPQAKFVIEGGSNWVLTGRYDPESETGHIDYQGHANGNYLGSEGNYGFYIDQGYHAGNGITVRKGRAASHATDFELEYIEVADTGFAGINIKNDDAPDAHMNNVKVHDLYIRDTETECMYIGNTSTGHVKQTNRLQHRLENLWVFNNRGVRCGAEGIQLSHVADGSRIFNNVILMSALDWKDPFQGFQEGQLQVMVRPGNITIENNILIGGVNTMVSPRFIRDINDTRTAPSRLTVRNNYFAYSRGSFYSYIHFNESNPGMTLELSNNFFGEMVMQRDEVVPTETAKPFFFQTKFNKSNPLIFSNNIFEGSQRGFQSISSGLNGVQQNLTATGNSYGSVVTPKFMISGFASDFDYRRVEAWSDCSRVYSNRPISYEVGDIVSFRSKFYQLTKPLASSYQCDIDYWVPCIRTAPNTYQINSYPTIGQIVDTVGERQFILRTAHEPYQCATGRLRSKNKHPLNDAAWEQIEVNITPSSLAGEEFWQEMPLPENDLRLAPDSEFKNAGLLDTVH